jgi:hypothetical protein
MDTVGRVDGTWGCGALIYFTVFAKIRTQCGWTGIITTEQPFSFRCTVGSKYIAGSWVAFDARVRRLEEIFRISSGDILIKQWVGRL